MKPQRSAVHRSPMYAETSSVRAAREQYFVSNGFSDAGYTDDWVKLKLGPFPITFPNTASRKRAIPLHDLHHVATGYPTTWIGEAEIGAWEVAGGCTDHWAAWVLNTGTFGYGLVLAPRRVYRAFMRGRKSRTLYHTGWDEALLELSVGQLRERLQIDRNTRVTWRDRFAFAGWVGLLASPTLAGLALAYVLLR
jgi:hypothetical protein